MATKRGRARRDDELILGFSQSRGTGRRGGGSTGRSGGGLTPGVPGAPQMGVDVTGTGAYKVPRVASFGRAARTSPTVLGPGTIKPLVKGKRPPGTRFGQPPR